jgi:hypothetical protein
MDWVAGYDKRDPAKLHHPLNTGDITAGQAHFVIHWMLVGCSVFAMLLVWWMSPAPVYALAFLIGWIVFGFAYNNGLSKESKTGCFAITGSMVSVAGFAWFLSHETMNEIGALFLVFTYFAIMYQISWSGFIKEMKEREPSNVLQWMGARVEKHDGEEWLLLGCSSCYGVYLKFFGLAVGAIMIAKLWDPVTGVIAGVFLMLAIVLMTNTMMDRKYCRPRELQQMSLMEICTIFLPVLPMLGLLPGLCILLATVTYFVAMNRLLWGCWYPRV